MSKNRVGGPRAAPINLPSLLNPAQPRPWPRPEHTHTYTIKTRKRTSEEPGLSYTRCCQRIPLRLNVLIVYNYIQLDSYWEDAFKQSLNFLRSYFRTNCLGPTKQQAAGNAWVPTKKNIFEISPSNFYHTGFTTSHPLKKYLFSRDL